MLDVSEKWLEALAFSLDYIIPYYHEVDASIVLFQYDAVMLYMGFKFKSVNVL